MSKNFYINNSCFHKKAYIVGFTKNEGSLEYYLQLDRVSNRTTEEKIAFLIRSFLKDYAFENIIASAIKHQYFSWNQSRNTLNSQYSNSVNNQRVNAITSIFNYYFSLNLCCALTLNAYYSKQCYERYVCLWRRYSYICM